MEPQTLDAVLQAATGAGGAVIVCLIVMFGGYNLIVKHMLPSQKESINDLVKEGRANRKVFVDAVELMARRLDRVEDSVEHIQKDIHDIKEKL